MKIILRDAKKAQKRLWKNYTPTATVNDENSKSFTGKVAFICFYLRLNKQRHSLLSKKVTEVFNGDGLVVKQNDGSLKKIFLSSIRPPRYRYHSKN